MSRPSNSEERVASMGQPPMRIPPRALLLSLVTLAVPVVGAAYVPEWLSEDRGLLLWLTPILPVFLLGYYREFSRVRAPRPCRTRIARCPKDARSAGRTGRHRGNGSCGPAD